MPRLVIAGLEGAFMLSRALRSTEPVERAGAVAAKSIAAALVNRAVKGPKRSDR